MVNTVNGQTLSAARATAWVEAGLRDTTTIGFNVIDMQLAGAVGNGITPNDSIMDAVLAACLPPGNILAFPTGNFLFQETINLPSDIVIRGQGPDQTIFTMNLGGSGNAINIVGSIVNADTSSLIQSVQKESDTVLVADSALFASGDWLQIIQIDTDLVTSAWAFNSVGQIVHVNGKQGYRLSLDSPLRLDFDLIRSPFVKRISPKKNVGIECLKIVRVDDCAPEQAVNIHFRYAVNCWVRGVESFQCTYAHIDAEICSNLSIRGCYIHHAFSYGGDGRGYGSMLHFTTGECRVEDNIFEHLRHSMIVQAGASGNVYAYNYSFDPYWESTPSNSAGDMVLHGNYTFLNLFEQNICRNIVIDDSHGPNGPYNTFFRNRAEGYGIFFSAANSPNQNFVGNDIPNTGFPYSLVNYTILGSGHFLYGNNNKGTIVPAGTQLLPDSSYAYSQRPDFVPLAQWAAIGTPNTMGAAANPAYSRYVSANIFGSSCSGLFVNVEQAIPVGSPNVFPVPFNEELVLDGNGISGTVQILNEMGQIIFVGQANGDKTTIVTRNWPKGFYLFLLRESDGHLHTKKLIK